MKKSIIFLLVFAGILSCALFQTKEEQREEDLYMTKLICDSNKNYNRLEKKYSRSSGKKREEIKVDLYEEKDYLQKLLARYQQKFDKRFEWNKCQKNKKKIARNEFPAEK